MKIIYPLVYLSSIFFVQQVKAISNKKMETTMDTIRIHQKETVKHETISITWKSFIIEETVESDGSPGSQSISLTIALESNGTEFLWQPLLPAMYKDYIEKQPNEVSSNFEGYTICITKADFENFNNAFIVLLIKKDVKKVADYFIDTKSVDETEFNKFLGTLKEDTGTWYCAEMKEGGMVGYIAKDAKGTSYEYRSITENGVSKISLTKKEPLTP